MKRIETDGMWSLFDPKTVPELVDLYGEAFEKAYCEAEEKNLFSSQIKARDLYARMMRTLAQTGNGWMTFKDQSNKTSNQTGYLYKEAVGDRIDLKEKNVIHLSNLCTEILEAHQ